MVLPFLVGVISEHWLERIPNVRLKGELHRLVNGLSPHASFCQCEPLLRKTKNTVFWDKA